MSQVFSESADQSGSDFAFQGFYKRDRGTQKLRIPTPLVNARANQKTHRHMLITRGQWPGPLTKCRSRKSEATSPNRRCSQRGLEILTSRRSEGGLARYTSAVSPTFAQICKICERSHPLPRQPFGGRGECFGG